MVALPDAAPAPRGKHRLVWCVPVLGWSALILSFWLLWTWLDMLGPLAILDGFPLNMFAGACIGMLFVTLSVGAGVLLTDGMGRLLIGRQGGWHYALATAFWRWTVTALLLPVLLFVLGVQFRTVPVLGAAVVALCGAKCGAWLSRATTGLSPDDEAIWRYAMILTWGGGWAAVACVIYYRAGF